MCVFYCHVANYPKTEQCKTTNLHSLTVSVAPGSGSSQWGSCGSQSGTRLPPGCQPGWQHLHVRLDWRIRFQGSLLTWLPGRASNPPKAIGGGCSFSQVAVGGRPLSLASWASPQGCLGILPIWRLASPRVTPGRAKWDPQSHPCTRLGHHSLSHGPTQMQ